MGRVTVAIELENLDDLYRERRGEFSPDQVRRVRLAEALVDTGATALSLPSRCIKELGLIHLKPRQALRCHRATGRMSCARVSCARWDRFRWNCSTSSLILVVANWWEIRNTEANT